MIRRDAQPRDNWQQLVEDSGLLWHTVDGKPYWDETAYYEFNMGQIEAIEEATENCYDLLLQAGVRIIENNMFHRFDIPDYAVPAIIESWEHESAALNYGRFDFGYDGTGAPKLFEFNCDTPTSLIEASVVQWNWKEALHPSADQFNSIHEKLVGRFETLRRTVPNFDELHFAHALDDVGEDTITVSYMRDCAEEAGLYTTGILMQELGLDSNGYFVDADDRPIKNLFKLYPWEWMLREEYGHAAVQAEMCGTTRFIEPIWKSIWSNKAILPILWDIAPEHPNLLPAFFDAPAFDMNRRGPAQRFFRKPLLSREGANITCIDADGSTVAMTNGSYGSERVIYQEAYTLPGEGNQRPVIGSWIINGEPAGMGIREDGLITGNAARFIPHIIKD